MRVRLRGVDARLILLLDLDVDELLDLLGLHPPLEGSRLGVAEAHRFQLVDLRRARRRRRVVVCLALALGERRGAVEPDDRPKSGRDQKRTECPH
jgi:hypothetical protein